MGSILKDKVKLEDFLDHGKYWWITMNVGILLFIELIVLMEISGCVIK